MRREVHGEHELLVAPASEGLGAVAWRQHGVVSSAQLRALGIGRGAIDWRVRHGALHPLSRGVYAVGHARLTLRGRYWAALLACGGPGAAVLSHRSAAAVWDLLPSPAGRHDVTTLRRGASSAAVRVHRTRSMRPADVTHDDGLPITTVTRTLIDLADVLTLHRLTRVCHRAEVLRVLDAKMIVTRLDELPGRRRRALRAALDTLSHADPHHTRSELEERFLALIAKFGLPQPRVNSRVEGHEVDFFWPNDGLIVETDGLAAHGTPTAFEHDRRRDAELQLAGYRVVRFTWRQIAGEPDAVARTLRALLGRTARRGR